MRCPGKSRVFLPQWEEREHTNGVHLLAIPLSHLVIFIILTGRFRSQLEVRLTMTWNIYKPIGKACSEQHH